ncbi:DUF2815 family protein [Allobaculum fili]|uniref:DUF2815 family protein n=1 Tax=Allobaculum fili TaxID=2834460 RepID=UPI001E4874A9|nr:DUF2815 family protein [Allobaculum fili]
MSNTKVRTGKKTRWSYANILEPKSINGSEPKYSVSLIIPKADTKTVDAIQKAIRAAYDEGLSKLKGNGKSAPAFETLKKPLRDGDLERPGDEAYANSYFINANSARRPQVVDRNLEPIADPDEAYSGCYGPVTVNFYAFNTSGNKGIAAGLGNLLKWADGERLDGSSTATTDFADLEDDDEDDLGF